jgi:hypothetical protein
MRLDPVKVRLAIADAEFPATPDELAESARRRGAGEEICTSLASLSDPLYNDVDSVMASLENQPS